MGPGLRKATRPRVHAVRCITLARLDANATRDWLDEAAVVSEGGLHDERYYGSTYVTVRDAALAPSSLAALVDADPHLRLRILRVAHREASARAAAPLETMRAEISIRTTADGVAIAVDVEADVQRFAETHAPHGR